MTDTKWDELKEHVAKMHKQAGELKGPAGEFIKHVWKDVKNKMWSIEKKHENL